MEPVPSAARVFFPLDEELAFLPGTLAPRQQSHLAQLGRWMPFRCASRVLEDLLGAHVSSETTRRLCEQVGKRVEEAQTAAARRPWKEDCSDEENDLRMVISADGAMVPLTGGEWAEVRTLAMGEVPPPAGAQDLPHVHVHKLSYCSRLTDAATFTDLAEAETRRRHLVSAKEVCAVMDGADWLQAFVEMHRSDAVRMLDFPHEASHLAKVLEALSARGLTFHAQMLERWQACAQTSWASSVEICKQDLVEPPPPAIALAPLLPSDPPAMIPGASRPSEHHPWKRGPACTPKQFAKR